MNSSPTFFQNILKKVILYGLPILYFLIAVSFYLKTYDSAQIKITLLQMGGLFLIMNWLILKIEENDFSFFKDNLIYLLPILLFLASGLLSYAISPFKLTSFNEFTRRFIYCFLAIIVITEFDDENKLLRIKNWLIFAAYVACVYGVIQLLDYWLFPVPARSGLDPFLWRQAFGYRVMSTFGNPNFFGDFLIVMNPIVLALFMRKKKFYLLFLWALIVVNVIATFSKGAWIGFAVGTFTFAAVYVLIFLRDKIKKEALIAIGVIVCVFVGIAFYGVIAKAKERTDSVSFRVFTWMSCWEMINTNPVLGTGIGSFYVTYPAYRRPQIFFIEGKHNTESDHPENEYLEVWFDEGILGISIFLLLIVFVFTLGYKNTLYLNSSNKTRDGPLAYIQLGVISAFAAKLSHDFVCVSLRFVSSGVMLWLLIGITISIAVHLAKNKGDCEKLKNVLSSPVKIILQIIIAVIFIYAIVYFAGYFKADILHSQAIQFSKMNNWNKALATYDAVNKNNPSYPMSKYFKTNVYIDRWQAGDPMMAERMFKGYAGDPLRSGSEIIGLWHLAPNYVQSKYLAGVMYSKIFDDARKLRQEFINSGKSQEVIEQQNRVIENAFFNAVKYYKEYIAIDPIYPLTYYGVAKLFESVGDLKTAEEAYYAHLAYPQNLSKPPHSLWVEDRNSPDGGWAKRRDGDYAETYLQLGNFYQSHGQIKAAVDAYVKGLKLVPAYIVMKKNLALAYAKLGEKNNALQQWKEIYQIDYDDADAINYLKKAGVLK
ncbi:O-antigen ligase family protein [Endomicrobium proavitum]|uniref:O-antigen ligase-related domain-containing protein n=1 Tax=Endomicrobium proavitum TaxID=1408281 RepID=A0A0G3WKH4_9BACT|nr:O-antigen ligase family protein [Endomicrobium proavitum]AKL97949.1 membrane protein of unknown function [Endomicrobium proavitum]